MSYNLLYYTQFDGAWTISDSNMIAIWHRIADEGIDTKIFYAGEISTPEQFIMYFKSARTFPFFIFSGDRFNNDDLQAIVWCTSIRGKSALLHFCVFKSGYGKGPELSKSAFTHIFGIKGPDGERIVNTIRGETPKFNRLAVKYLKTIGMKILGEIPDMAYNRYTNELSSMVISYLTYDEFVQGVNDE